MIGSSPSGKYGALLAICLFALILALLCPAPAAAQDAPPGPPPDDLPPPSDQPPTRPPGNGPPGNGPPGNGPPDNGPPGNGPPTNGNGGGPPPPQVDPTLSEYERIKALAPNRIVFHAATPIQLCKVEDGLQIYFISRKGKTRLGPWVPSFAELAASGKQDGEVSIYFGFNPFTGKPVKIDYLPEVNRIRVDTFYADREHDKNKHYIFHFGPEHDIVYDAW